MNRFIDVLTAIFVIVFSIAVAFVIIMGTIEIIHWIITGDFFHFVEGAGGIKAAF